MWPSDVICWQSDIDLGIYADIDLGLHDSSNGLLPDGSQAITQTNVD